MNKKKLPQKEEKELMSDYERDLTWMAYRYAIGRHTIHAHDMCCQMVRHIYGRVTRERSIFMAQDIQQEIAMYLRMMPVKFSVETNSNSPVLSLDSFIEYLDSKGYKGEIELQNIKSVTSIVDEENKLQYYDETFYKEGECKKDLFPIKSMYIRDLMCWNNLAKLLDYRLHLYCLCKRSESSELILTEYFESYMSKQSVGFEYEKVKVPVESFHKNPYLDTRIEESAIIKSGLSEDEMMEYRDNRGIKVFGNES